ncbi:molybdopterin-dependent oxidoreductase [Arsenicicoccus piscis]|nr:molybdopterin-dependent oxidoreductase [Arsenicicoccus piscis]MCH8628640.1 molybdopterin-dependent oxidoreductase [Arsenicicoccus piscis]
MPPWTEPRATPPGQRLVDEVPVRHYGRVPSVDARTWTLSITGDTASGEDTHIDYEQLVALGETDVVADLHCVSKVTGQDLRWRGVLARAVVDLAPPADGVEHALVVAEYGYAATLRVEDLSSPRALLALALDGAPLAPERGGPVRLVVPHLYSFKGPKWLREICYTSTPERGFWEERGYHLVGDAWREERYAYQE